MIKTPLAKLSLALGVAALLQPTYAAPGAVGLAGTLPDLKKVEMDSSNLYDYTFSTAPTDWKVQTGVWEMTNRWSCSPGWSWFGGRSDEVAAIWNKRKLSGDMSAQMYFAFKMGMSGVPQWPEYPADAAITICGDGQNLGSGYVFIAGADDNTRSVLMKNGKVVAESKAPAAILPRLTDGKPGNEAMHRRWWYARLDKSGNKIEARLDNEIVLSYTDPDPIMGGQTAIWTYNNGIMLARVQLYYQNEVRRIYAKAPIDPPSASPANKPIKTTLAQGNRAEGKMQ